VVERGGSRLTSAGNRAGLESQAGWGTAQDSFKVPAAFPHLQIKDKTDK
jgi:hypothetical protein